MVERNTDQMSFSFMKGLDMPKVTVEFNLPEDEVQYTNTLFGSHYKSELEKLLKLVAEETVTLEQIKETASSISL